MSRRSNDGLIPGYDKIRKRGCSSSPSSSSKMHNYRFKRAIMVGKTRVGVGSRSSTPAPSWRMTPSSKSKLGGCGGGGVESPNFDGGGGRSRPVSARKLAATLWEMNEMPSPQNSQTTRRKKEKESSRVREKPNRFVHTPGSLPPHLSDPSHSPVSERMERSGTGSHRRISSSYKARVEDNNNNGEVFDSPSNTSLMEIETRPRAQTPNSSINGVKPRLKEVSNALTTSKELLKIIHRMWAHDNLPSSSMSLISALHTELERARLQVNHIIKDQHVDHSEVNYLLKCFAEEKALWKSKERRAVESAIETIANELEAEKKTRRRSESLNKKLGHELAETKAAFAKVVKELENEKRAREIMEQVCNELAVDMTQDQAETDRAETEELKREMIKAQEEVEKEREMLQLADKLREERVQMKLAEAKHQFEEKNALVDKLKTQLEAFLGNKKKKKKGRKDEDLITYLNKSNLGASRLNNNEESFRPDDGEVEDDEGSGDSDLHSIELNMDNNNKSFKWNHGQSLYKDLVNGKASRRSTTSVQRTRSDGNAFLELEKQTPRRSHGDDLVRYKSVKGLRDRVLTNLKARDFDEPGHGSGSKSRGESFNGRRSRT